MSAPWWWSWLLMSVGVSSLYLAGRKSMWGWALGIGGQTLWLAYSVTTRQWGFLASCFVYGSVYVINFRRWRAEAAQAKSKEEVEASQDA